VLILNDNCRDMLFCNVKTINPLHVPGARNFSDKVTANIVNPQTGVTCQPHCHLVLSVQCMLTYTPAYEGEKTTVLMLTILGAIIQNHSLGD